MGILMMIKNDIRKRKSQAAVIFLLSFLITLLMSTAVSVLWQSQKQYDDAAVRMHLPEVINIFNNEQRTEADKVIKSLRKQPETEDVFKENILLLGGDQTVRFQNDSWFSSGTIIRSFPDQYSLTEGSRDQHGIYLTVTLKDSKNLEIGDFVTLKLSGQERKYKIAGFFEDPFLGSTMTGFKQLFLDQGTFQELIKTDTAQRYQSTMISLWTDPNKGKNFTSRIKSLNENTGFARQGTEYIEQPLMKMSAMALTDIFLGLIFLFSLLLLTVMLITIRYLIASSLEDDYKELGILNSIGYSKRKLLAGKILQITFLFGAGGAAGLLGSFFTVPSLGAFAMDGSGILWHGGIRLVPVVLSILVIALFVILIAWLSLRCICRISTVQAIRNGKEDVHFKKRYQVSLEKISLPSLPLKLAVKNVSVRLPQYLLLVIVCGFMIYSMVSISALNENMSDIKKTAVLFGSSVSDISVANTSDSAGESDIRFQELFKDLKEMPDVRLVYSAESQYLDMENQKMLLQVVSRFDGGNYLEPLKGRVPKYDNEMMLTEVSSEYLEKYIGDTVKVSHGGRKKEYLVVGIYQSTSDAGKVGCMSLKGFQQLDPDFKYQSCELILKKNAGRKSVIKKVKVLGQQDGLDLKVENVEKQIESQLKEAQLGILALVVLFYILCIFITGFITFLLSITLLKQQRREFAVQRSMGYSVRSLRLQFSFSFGIIGLLGTLFGLLCVGLFTNRMFGALFGNLGITKFSAEITVFSTLVPVLIIVGFLISFSYLISGRIKKYGVRQLAEDI